MRFLHILIQVCSGTGIFLRLQEIRFWKVLLHVFTLTLLLSLLLAFGHSCSYSRKINTVCHNLFEKIGGICFTPEGIRTMKHPQEMQSFILGDDLRLDYYPGKTLSPEKIPVWKQKFGFVCMNQGVVFWSKNRNEANELQYTVFPVLALIPNPSIRFGLDQNHFFDYLKNGFEQSSEGKIIIGKNIDDVDSVVALLNAMVRISLFTASFLTILFSLLMTVLPMSLIAFFRNRESKEKISGSAIVKIMIYMTFPALIIASLYSFVMIPLISPQLVYLIVFFIYYVAVFRRIQQQLNHPEKPENDNP